jgi:hypothetical protein
MKSATLLIIRLALAVQFFAVLSVPTLIASAESPRAMWLVEWIRPSLAERTIGVLTMRDGKLTFSEQVGQAGWELDLANVKRVAAVNGGRALAITSHSGEEFVTLIMDPSLMPQSPKRAMSTIERALQVLSTNNR